MDTIVENMKGTVLRYEQHSRVIVIAVVCVIVVFVSLMSFTTITQLRKRISSLESDMQRLETGNLSRLLAEDGKDEIGQISKSINNFLVIVLSNDRPYTDIVRTYKAAKNRSGHHIRGFGECNSGIYGVGLTD